MSKGYKRGRKGPCGTVVAKAERGKEGGSASTNAVQWYIDTPILHTDYPPWYVLLPYLSSLSVAMYLSFIRSVTHIPPSALFLGMLVHSCSIVACHYRYFKGQYFCYAIASFLLLY